MSMSLIRKKKWEKRDVESERKRREEGRKARKGKKNGGPEETSTLVFHVTETRRNKNALWRTRAAKSDRNQDLGVVTLAALAFAFVVHS